MSHASRADPEPAVIPTRSITPAQIDPDALKVARRLQRFGHLAYLVGGCVRDLLLRRTPKDFDVVTSARPAEIRKLFRNCRLIGRRFRLAHIHFRGKIIETATFRASTPVDENGDLLIREDNVYGSEREDAYRRDFTINALFYDPVERQLIDYVGGLVDLVERKVRFIGMPSIRVQEDPVRILRAIKFASRLDFRIERATWKAVRDYRAQIHKAAAPRLIEEIVRMLRGGAAEASFRLMWEAGVLEVLLPELSRYLSRSPERGEERDPGSGLWAYLRAIDRSDREMLTSAVLLSAVMVHPVWDAVASQDFQAYDIRPSSRTWGEVAKEILRPLISRIRLPRWEAERIQQLLASQRRLFDLQRNNPLPKALMRRAYFPEALDMFDLGVRATGKGRRTLARLQRSYRKPAAPKATGSEPAALTRRRGRRRRRRKSDSAPH
ncbi:MAG: polynucleotide adenylyltransferase PcnB [Deltaproteobacteria bacterium]|nr:polynucleotide adenylyltransferase PcnB [Deltaproteobacteria bacterium]